MKGMDNGIFGLRLISAGELARAVGYQNAGSAFRAWCARMRITPVPGRRAIFDPALVRRRLDEAQGLANEVGHRPLGLVNQRRARLGKD